MRQKSELEYRLLKEKIAEIKEENESASRLRKQTERMHNKSLDEIMNNLLILSKDKNSYVRTSSGTTLIETVFYNVKKYSAQLLKKLPKRGYSELSDALSRVIKEASSVCDMIHCHKDFDERYKWGSKRIQNFVHSYNLKIKGSYLN